MSKLNLAAVIRNHLIVAFGRDARSSQCQRQLASSLVEGAAAVPRSLSPVAVPKLELALHHGLRAAEIETMQYSPQAHPPAPMAPLVRDCALASLARTAPLVCSQFQRLDR
jgi:hypothetical protein